MKLIAYLEGPFGAVLVYFDELNDNKYSSRHISDDDFVDSQIPLSELFYHRYLHGLPIQVAAKGSLPMLMTLATQKEITEYSMVSEECLDQLSLHYTTGIFTKEHLSKF